MQQDHGARNQLLLGLIAIAVLAVLVGGVIYVKGGDKTSPTPQTSQQTQSSSQVASETTTNASTYKDGTYTADGNYNSPGGTESISVTVTLTDNKISEASVTTQAASGQSADYQQQFANGFKSQVIGKLINEVSLSKVSGSSLTSRGFNNALDEIKTQAQS